MPYLQHRPVRTGPLPPVVSRDIGREPSHFGFGVARGILAPLGQEAKVVAIPGLALEECLGQLEQFHDLPVPSGELQFRVEHEHAVLHVVEGDTQDRSAPLQFGRALLDQFFQADGRVGAFCQQMVELDGVSPEHFDGASHRGNFVGSGGRNGDFAPSRREGQHRTAQLRQPRYEIAVPR